MMQKRLLSVFFALMAVLPFLHAEVLTGNCGAQGDNVTYTLDTETGLLTISGTGAMVDYRDDAPWFNYSVEGIITKIDIEYGVTSISGFMRTSVTDVVVPNSVTKIAEHCFYECQSIEKIQLSENLVEIGSWAFRDAFGERAYEQPVVIPPSVKKIGSNIFLDSYVDVVFWPHYNDVEIGPEDYFLGKLDMSLYVHDADYKIMKDWVGNTVRTQLLSLNDYYLDSQFDIEPSKIVFTLTPKFDNVVVKSVSYCRAGTGDYITVAKSSPYIIDMDSSTEYEIKVDLSIDGLDRTLYYTPIITGNCGAQGDNVTYTLNTETGLLIISGTGAMADYGYDEVPWDEYVKKVIIEEGVTRIGEDCFSLCHLLESVTLPEGLKEIGGGAFYNSSSILNNCSIAIPPSVNKIDGWPFFECQADIFFWPLYNEVQSDVDESFFYGLIGTLYVQEVDLEYVKQLELISHNVLSLNDYYLDSQFDIEPSKIKLTLTPKFDNVVVKSVSYRRAGTGDYTTVAASSPYIINVDPLTEYDIKVDLTIDGLDRTLYYTRTSSDIPNPTISLIESTQTTLKFKVEAYNDGAVRCDESGVYAYLDDTYFKANSNGEVTITDKGPDREDSFQAYAKYGERILVSQWDFFSTKPMSPSISIDASASSITATGSYIHGDAKVIGSGFTESESSTEFIGDDVMVLTGLTPNTSYRLYYAVKVESGGSEYTYRTEAEAATSGLVLVTEQAQPTSTTSVRLKATANLDDAEVGAGFEWKRYDAPDEMLGTVVSCPVVDGMIVGSLRNVNPEAYYKYRAVYRANDGSEYFGDWVVFFTGDATVYFEPEVRTYKPESVTTDGAVLTGYALDGTDDIEKQGFEYWPVDGGAMLRSAAPGQVQTVFASGIKMEVELTGLAAGTTYAYRAFATTDEGTIYGTEMQFTTEPASGIAEVVASEAEGLAVMLRGNPVDDGTAWVKVSGASGQVLRYRINSLSGQTVGGGILPDYDGWNAIDASFAAGLYLLTVDDGLKSKTVKMIVR